MLIPVKVPGILKTLLAECKCSAPHVNEIFAYNKVRGFRSVWIHTEVFVGSIDIIRGSTTLNPVETEIWFVIDTPL